MWNMKPSLYYRLGCAHTANTSDIEWYSLELEVPQTVTKVQIARRMGCCWWGGQNVSITIGPSKEYDPNEPLCLPEIPDLVREGGLQDYVCTGDLHQGKYVKISKVGVLVLCEVKVFTRSAGEYTVKSLNLVACFLL